MAHSAPLLRRGWICILAIVLVATVLGVPPRSAEANGGPDIVILGGSEVISDAVEDYLETCTLASVDRVAGADRYATAAAFAQWAGFPTGGTAIVVTGENFPDALTAGPRASHETSPILLTRPTSLPGPTSAALAALSPSRTVIIGGNEAVSAGVQAQIEAGPFGTVERMAGLDRYQTAAMIANWSNLTGTAVYVATGENYPDALAGSHAAARVDAPILLVARDTIPLATKATLTVRDPQTIVILGGEAVVSPAMATELATYAPTVRRLAGANRYGTAAAISRDSYPSGASKIYIATGENFPDALAAGAIAGPFVDGPILLATQNRVPAETAAEISRFSGLPCAAFNADAGDFIYQLSGSGDDVRAATTPGDRPGVVRFNYGTSSSNFIVWALDASLSNTELLVNEIGAYTGIRPVNTGDALWPVPMRYLDITASGSWTATVMSMNQTRVLSTSISGSTDDVVRVTRGGIAGFTYTGTSNFIVWAHGNGQADLLVNEIGSFTGNEVIPAFTEFLEIRAIGDWSVEYK